MNASIVLKLLDGVTGPIRQVQQAIANASKAMESFSERADKAFERGEHIKISGEKVKEFAEGAREAVEKMVKPFETLEQSLKRVEAVTGASKEQMEGVEQAARKIGASGRAGADEAAGALEIMATSGFKVTAAVDTLGTMLDRAKVQNVSLAEATAGATSTAKKFGLALEAGVITHLNDLTAKMAIASGTSFGNMTAALDESGVAAKAAGVSIERTTQLVGLLATKGIQGGAAGEALNLMFRNLGHANVQKVITEASGGMVKLRDSTGALRDPLKILTELTADMTKKGVSMGAQTTFLNQLFPRNAAKIQALMAAASGPGMDKLNEALKDVAGTTKSMADKELENGIDKTKALDGAMQNLESTIGATMAPRMDEFKGKLAGVINGTTAWLNENPKLAFSLGLVAQGASVGAGALEKFTSVATIFLALKGAGLTAASWATFGSKMTAAFGPIVALAGPIAAVSAAVAGLGLAIFELHKHWEELNSFSKIGEGFKGIGDSIGDSGVLSTLGQAFDPRTMMHDIGQSFSGPQGGAAANGSVDVNVHGGASATVGKGSTGVNVNHDPRAGTPMVTP